MLFEIKSWLTGTVLFSLETSSMRLCVEAAVKKGVDLYRADLSSADLSSANLYSADLSGADLSRAELSSANLYSADLSRAELSSANLYRADLSSADLSSANLSSANLYSADLSRADLYRADLYRADLSSANLYRANLYSADLSRADLSSAHLYRATGIDPHRCTPLLMLLDQPGPIRAYKLVTQEGVGPFNGGITYEVGNEYSVSDADTDVTCQCGAGINLATLDWCISNWSEGYRVLIAEFVAADIAAIPTATDGKFRVHRCSIVGEKDLTEIGLGEKAEVV